MVCFERREGKDFFSWAGEERGRYLCPSPGPAFSPALGCESPCRDVVAWRLGGWCCAARPGGGRRLGAGSGCAPGGYRIGYCISPSWTQKVQRGRLARIHGKWSSGHYHMKLREDAEGDNQVSLCAPGVSEILRGYNTTMPIHPGLRAWIESNISPRPSCS